MDSGESKGELKKSRKRKARDLDEKTPSVLSESLSEFFAENRTCYGFDNPGKALYSTVRVLVENGLDSAESISVLPVIDLTIEEKIIGTVKDSKKIEEATAAKPMKGTSIYLVSCKDNGVGIPHEAVPDLFGRVSFRKKCGIKQTRGKFGYGTKMVSIWSKLSTGRPISIDSGMEDKNYETRCILDIDIHSNTPNIMVHAKIKRPEHDPWHGTKIGVEIEGSWTAYGPLILEYVRQMAVITPYAEINFHYVPAHKTADNDEVNRNYPRISDKMPPVSEETKYHPSAVDSLIIERLISQTSYQNLLHFLLNDFANINKAQALKLIGQMGPGVTSKTKVNSLTFQQIARMYQLFQQTKFDDPSGNILRPLGEEALALSMCKVIKAEVGATITAKSAHAYQGHPFLVEVGLCVGGQDLETGFNIFRFANRAPLLLEGEADVVTSVVKRIKWRRYQVYEERDKVGIFVNILSTKVPFKLRGSECIISEIGDAVKSCLEECGEELKQEIIDHNTEKYLFQTDLFQTDLYQTETIKRGLTFGRRIQMLEYRQKRGFVESFGKMSNRRDNGKNRENLH